MRINLVSEDVDLSKLCQAVSRHLTISAGSIDKADDADQYIWAFQPHVPIPEHIGRNTANTLFLVHRKDLKTFRKAIEAAEGNILLKPATRRVLETFLDYASSLRADRDEILQCLIQTTLNLQEYEQDRTNFLVRFAHDFCVPLTGRSGYCGLLLGGRPGTLHGNKPHVKRSPDLRQGDIRKCLDQALHEIAPFAAEKRISIVAESCGVGLYFERGQIDQVCLNVLDNACRFTPKGGLIEIRGYRFLGERRGSHSLIQPSIERRLWITNKPNSYRVDTRDSGTIIPEEHLNSIFEEYTRTLTYGMIPAAAPVWRFAA